MENRTEIHDSVVVDWPAYVEWGMSTGFFEEQVAKYCCEVVTDKFKQEFVEIVRALVQKILKESVKRVGAIIQTERFKLLFTIAFLENGVYRVGFSLDDAFAQLEDKTTEITQYEETSLSTPFPVLFLFALRQFLELASRRDLLAEKVILYDSLAA